MTLRPAVLSAAVFMFLVAPTASREEPLLRGVYSSEENCASGHRPMSEEFTYLHEGGVDEFEGGCFFLQYIEEPLQGNDFSGFIATGYCQEPGSTSPHLFHVRRFSELADGRYTMMLSYQDRGELVEIEFHPCPSATE